MPDPVKTKRQKIVDAQIARFQDISTANGYQTNLGANVKDWAVHFNEDDLPALSVCDLIVEAKKEFMDQTVTIRTLTLSLRIFSAADGLAEDLRKLIGDVESAIKLDPRWMVEGIGLAMDTWPDSERIIIPTPGNDEAAGAEIVIKVDFKTGTFDAYQ